jgi:hypothetical protein
MRGCLRRSKFPPEFIIENERMARYHDVSGVRIKDPDESFCEGKAQAKA